MVPASVTSSVRLTDVTDESTTAAVATESTLAVTATDITKETVSPAHTVGQPEVTSAPDESMATTPATEEQTCIRDGVTYLEGQRVPPANSCQESCKCRNATVQCKQKACMPAPPAFLQCVAVDKPDQCCPSYDCRE